MSLVTARSVIDVDWSRCVLPPFEHQKEGVRELVKWNDPAKGRIIGGVFALFDEMGLGKTKQVIDSACFLADAGEIDTALIVTPASVRAVWASDFGEIEKHAWFPRTVAEYHARTPRLPFAKGRMNWVVTNFDFVRNEDRLFELIDQLRGRRIWGVVDESIRIKSHKAAQTKTMLKLAPLMVRRSILNGTPIGNNPLDLWAQFQFLDPRIIGSKNFFHFRAAYAVMGGYMNKQVIGWQRLEELQAKIAPYVLRRLKEDCLDLPDKTYTVREARLTPATWKLYKQMRDECVAWLNTNQAVTAPQAVVRLLRLSQLTTGFIGGVPQPEDGTFDFTTGVISQNEPKEIGREKLDVLLEQIEDLLETDEPRVRILIWCRFRAELDRAAKAVATKWPHVTVGRIEGGQREADRRATVEAFQGQRASDAPMVLFGNPQAGGLGLTLTAAHHVIYTSNDYSLTTRLQSEDRVHRPGQRHPVLYTDVIATGPDGQRTIDHVILNALRRKSDLARWTTDVWRRELTE